MNVVAAVSSVFRQYAVFSGRARRSEYWWYFLFYLVVYAVVLGVSLGMKSTVPILVFALVLFLPTLAVAVRRLHDTGRSGWYLLIGIVPLIGSIALLVFTCQDSDFDNQYGPSPKFGRTAPAGGYA